MREVLEAEVAGAAAKRQELAQGAAYSDVRPVELHGDRHHDHGTRDAVSSAALNAVTARGSEGDGMARCGAINGSSQARDSRRWDARRPAE